MCPHCHTQVPETASVCTGCGAEIVRGPTRRERSALGCGFMIVAILAMLLLLHALEVLQGRSPLPSPTAEGAFSFFLALIALLAVPYLLGKAVARMLWRSKLRFFRRYHHD